MTLSISTPTLALPLLLLPLLLIPLYLLLLRPATRKSGDTTRPPLVASWLPFVGSALRMASGDAFWLNARKKYGPAFRLHAMGETRVFVLTPQLISHIYKHSKSFDFYYFRKSMQSHIFGMSHARSFSPVVDDKLFPSHHRGMQPGAIGDVIARYVDELEAEVDKFIAALSEDGAEDLVNLEEWCFSLIYTTSAHAFFGPTFPSASTLRPFQSFDKSFPLLNLSRLPVLFRKPALSARDALLDQLDRWLCDKGQVGAMAPAMRAMMDVAEGEGWKGRDTASLVLAELWALEANAPYGAIWTLVEILRRPALLALLRSELAASPPPLSSLLRLPQPQLVQHLPTLNACFQETLRFHTSTLSLRIVAPEGITLPASLCENDTGYALRGGEQVVCVTRVPHVDQEGSWGEDAGEWRYERWLDGGGGKKGAMNPFGGGVSMCEGRHFASAEILTFLASAIARLDVEIIHDSLAQDPTRVGLGVVQPKGHLRVRLSPRRQ